MVVGEFTSFSRETKVCNGRDLELGEFKALGPFVFGLVLDFEAEELVLEVSEAGLGRNLGIANSTDLVHVLDCVISMCV